MYVTGIPGCEVTCGIAQDTDTRYIAAVTLSPRLKHVGSRSIGNFGYHPGDYNTPDIGLVIKQNPSITLALLQGGFACQQVLPPFRERERFKRQSIFTKVLPIK